MDLILLFIAIFTNSGLATRKGKSPFLWGFIPLMAFLLTYGILGAIYILMTFKGPLTPENINAIQEYSASLQNNFLTGLMVALFGVGGALVVRALLSRYPDIKAPENNE